MALILTTLTMPRQIKKEDPFTPNTPYQHWLWPRLIRRGVTVAELARLIGKDYNYVWKIAKGDPTQNDGANNIPTRPGFDIAKAIGEALGDIAGSLEAAGYSLEELFGGRLLVIEVPGWEPVRVIVPSEYTPDMQRDLTLSVESSLAAMRRRKEAESTRN